MTVVVHLRDVDRFGVHPFKGMASGQSGQRLRAIVLLPALQGDESGNIYSGEAMLFGWSDDSLNGITVRLLLDSGPDGTRGRHPFDGLRVGRKSGEDLVFTAWALAENSEHPVDPKFVRRRRPFHEHTGTTQAHILSRDRRFCEWLAGRLASIVPDPERRRLLPDPKVSIESFAAETIRAWCSIPSRAVLGHETPEGERARAKWGALLEAYDDDVFGRSAELSGPA
jgi:hypothetical protein